MQIKHLLNIFLIEKMHVLAALCIMDKMEYPCNKIGHVFLSLCGIRKQSFSANISNEAIPRGNGKQ